MELFDLGIDIVEAERELDIAKAETQHLRSDHERATSARDRVASYRQASAQNPYEIVAMGQQVYVRMIGLVEEVTARYRELLRQAQYEYLPYDDTGESLLSQQLQGSFDVNLTNFPDVAAAVRQLDTLIGTIPNGRTYELARELGSGDFTRPPTASSPS